MTIRRKVARAKTKPRAKAKHKPKATTARGPWGARDRAIYRECEKILDVEQLDDLLDSLARYKRAPTARVRQIMAQSLALAGFRMFMETGGKSFDHFAEELARAFGEEARVRSAFNMPAITHSRLIQ